MNRSLPKITIIIATYNSERTIKLCLKSCLSQDYLNKEIIIADGKSTDKTIKIVKVGFLCSQFKEWDGLGSMKT